MAREWTVTLERKPRCESSGAVRSRAKTRTVERRVDNLIDFDKELAIIADLKDYLPTIDQAIARSRPWCANAEVQDIST